MKLIIFEIPFVERFFHIENSLSFCLFLLEYLFFKFCWGIRAQQDFVLIDTDNCVSQTSVLLEVNDHTILRGYFVQSLREGIKCDTCSKLFSELS